MFRLLHDFYLSSSPPEHSFPELSTFGMGLNFQLQACAEWDLEHKKFGYLKSYEIVAEASHLLSCNMLLLVILQPFS